MVGKLLILNTPARSQPKRGALPDDNDLCNPTIEFDDGSLVGQSGKTARSHLSGHQLEKMRRLVSRSLAGSRALRAHCHARNLSTKPAVTVQDVSMLQPITAITEDESMMQEAARRFAADEVLPRADAMDRASCMEPELISAIFEAGFMGIEIGEEFGGSGSSFTAACLVIEELAKADPAVSVMVDIHNTIVNNTFTMWASAELQEQWLPQLATGTLGAFCLSEAGSGSDAFALKTTATAEAGGDYVLRGEKMWISNSAEAGVFLAMANAAPEKGYKGITCFVVPADTAGLSLGPREDKLGIRASSTCPVRFDEVRVPASSVLGQTGMGYRYAIEILNEGRIGIGAQMIGLAQGALDRTLPYLHERKQFGTAIADFQGVQHQLATLATELEAARLLVYNAARLPDDL
jgi:short-chain 2-methylacyl-CoA dehydrogenase